MRKFLLLVLCLAFTMANAQTPRKLTSGEIHQSIKKLNFLGSVLYIAAHPDDENTRLISYFSNGVQARTAYLSITRGDGGQNLIGPELKELLGIIRTQELLAARKIDGGEQLFTRAIDFGYTKTPEEAMEIWEKDEVLSDVVWAIRSFQPDIVINRFDHRTAGETHGQHTASALLGIEAFDLAGDPESFKEQLNYTKAFAPKRLYFNTSPWFYSSEEEFEKESKDKFLQFDTGIYFPSKGLSNPEIAALSRSEHQSQGFGSTGTRGSQLEYLELLKGEMPEDQNSLFANIDTTWKRLKNGAPIEKIINQIELEYDFKDPAASIPKLIEAYKMIDALETSHWKEIKIKDIKEIIAAAAGLYLDAYSTAQSATRGEKIEINLEVINRSNTQIILTSIELEPNNSRLEPRKTLENNVVWKNKARVSIGNKAKYTSPYWVEEKGSMGLYTVNDQTSIGLPFKSPSVNARFILNIWGVEIPYERAITYKFNDAVKGEIYQPFNILPPVSVQFEEKVLIFANGDAKNVPVKITAGKDSISGDIKFKGTGNWKIEPQQNTYDVLQKGESITLNFRITPPSQQDEAYLTPIVTYLGEEYSGEVVKIQYDHIPMQNIVVPAQTKLVKLSIKKKGENIGYVEGAGDVIPESLRQIGYNVSIIDPSNITAAALAGFDAIVMGIRAYNTVNELKYKQPLLLDYVKNGGTLIVQYNVNRGMVANPFSPFKLNLSRDRVTQENSEVRFVNPEHSLLNSPNKITAKDFEGWVQERGLYFANSWAPEFTPILSMNDDNEDAKEGSLLVAKYGEGYFIYTGLSFFRQFPEGIPGAYRLFANMVSIGK